MNTLILEMGEMIIKIDPKDKDAWYDRAYALEKLDMKEEAIKSYGKAIALPPSSENAEPLYRRGLLLEAADIYDEALKDYKEALKLRDDWKIWKHKGIVEQKLGLLEDALASYEEALERRPEEGSMWYSKGAVLEALHRYEEALIAYEKAIKLMPKDPDAWYSRGNVLSILERHEDAVSSFSKAIFYNKKNIRAWLNSHSNPIGKPLFKTYIQASWYMASTKAKRITGIYYHHTIFHKFPELYWIKSPYRRTSFKKRCALCISLYYL
jgi:tetratricopeptide (TPR) repeat protein